MFGDDFVFCVNDFAIYSIFDSIDLFRLVSTCWYVAESEEEFA